MATGILSSGEIAPTNRQILAEQDNVGIFKGEVYDINTANKTVSVHLQEYDKVFSYDSLIVAAGAGQSYFGNDHFAAFAPGMKTIDDALELRARIVGAFERAELVEDPAERERLLTFVIVGAGPTGVELAGQVAEMAHRTLSGFYRRANPANAKIILLDGAPQVLPPFGKRLGRNAQRSLEKIGVTVKLNAIVTDVNEKWLPGLVDERSSRQRRETAPGTIRRQAGTVGSRGLVRGRRGCGWPGEGGAPLGVQGRCQLDGLVDVAGPGGGLGITEHEEATVADGVDAGQFRPAQQEVDLAARIRLAVVDDDDPLGIAFDDLFPAGRRPVAGDVVEDVAATGCLDHRGGHAVAARGLRDGAAAVIDEDTRAVAEK